MLYFVNVPYDCSDQELREWVESRGVGTRSIRVIRDLVAYVSPAFAYVELEDDSCTHDAISVLHGRKLRNQVIQVKEAGVRTTFAGACGSRRVV